MASLVNPYFASKFSNSLEQSLFQGLATECIQVMGFTGYYIIRKSQKLDPILGEDNLTKFETAIPIEMMMEDVGGWRNDSEMISKFGLEIRNDMTFLVSKPRWNTEVSTHTAEMMVPTRPQEGDLIWEPLSKALLEIKFVEHEDQFYPLGTNYYFKLKCEYFQYNSEDMATGVPDIDGFENKSNNLLDYQLTLEDGGMLLQEDGYSLFLDVATDIGTSFAENNDFKKESLDISWSVDSPFGD